MVLRDEFKKFQGPTFNAMIDFASMNKHSLIREIEVRTPTELAAIVVGVSVYEVFRNMPECDILIRAMVEMKENQLKVDRDKIFLWMNANLSSRKRRPIMNQRYMQRTDMRLFLEHFPMGVLPDSVFKPFIYPVTKFLLKHLMRFRRRRMLYRCPPGFPPENNLPYFINAIGPMHQLEKNYPHLAHVKHEMIVNITHFVVTYCLDWVCETLTLRVNNFGFVTYSYPETEEEADEAGVLGRDGADYLNSDPETSKKQRVEEELSDHEENCRNAQADAVLSKNTVLERKSKTGNATRDVAGAGPSTSKSSTPTNQQTSLMENDPQRVSLNAGEASPRGGDPLKNFSVRDDWSEMLDAALTDPNLPAHYKTMIRCLVATNRDLRSVVNMMK